MKQIILILLVLIAACNQTNILKQEDGNTESSEVKGNEIMETSKEVEKQIPKIKLNLEELEKFEKATFAGGCFWCMEGPFEKMQGVKEVLSGYSGGTETDATYREVSAGRTEHVEAVQIYYDNSVVSYSELVEVYWKQINPTDDLGQFADKGTQYRAKIFYRNDEEKEIAQISKLLLGKSGEFSKPIVTEILPYTNFFPAEEYHQDYYLKNYEDYSSYRRGSGRERFLVDHWEEDYEMPTDEEIKEKLTSLQFKVTQNEGTEQPFDNEYWDNKKEGIYVDIVSGEPLFSSIDKFKSGTGWPSFTKPLVPENILKVEDSTLGMKRVEVKSKHANSHLGHVFDDGPNPTGLRYCLNSASMKFIAKEDLKKEGYGEFEYLFK